MNRLLTVPASYIMHMALLSVENIILIAEYIEEVRALRLFWQGRGFRMTGHIEPYRKSQDARVVFSLLPGLP